MLNLKKTTKYLFRNPRQLFKNSFSDYKKDKSKIKFLGENGRKYYDKFFHSKLRKKEIKKLIK